MSGRRPCAAAQSFSSAAVYGRRCVDQRRALTLIFWTAVAVSVVHYADNYFNYAQYPRSATLPNPSQALIGVSWFVFTAIGLAGYLLFRRHASDASLLLLALYSGSGLVGIGHYTVAGGFAMPWWRQAHVVIDIACGLAVLGFVVWVVRGRHRHPAAPVTPNRGGPRPA